MYRLKNTDWFSNNPTGSDFKRRVIKSGGITVLSQAVAYSVQMVGTIVMARMLSPEDFGLCAFVTLFSLLLMNFGVKFSEAIIQEKKISHELISNIFWLNIGVSLGLAFIFIAFTPLLIWFFKEPRIFKISLFMALTIFLPALSIQHSALLKRKMIFQSIAIMEITAATASVLLGIVLAAGGAGYWAIVAKQVAFYITGTITVWFFCPWRPGSINKNIPVAKILRFTIKTYSNYCLTYFGRSLDKILVGRFFGTQILGNYDRAATLSSAFPNQLITPLTGVAIATLSRLRDDPAKFCRYYQNLVAVISFVGMGVSMVLAIVGRDLITFILGPQWKTAGTIFIALAAGLGVSLVCSTTTWVHISLGRAERALYWSIFSLVLTTVLLISGLLFGVIGVAIGTALSSFILAGPAFRYALKPLHIRDISFFKITGKHIMSALAAGTSGWLIFYSGLTMFVSIFKSIQPLRILFVSTFCILVYIGLEIAFCGGLKTLNNLVDIIRILMSRQQSDQSGGIS